MDTIKDIYRPDATTADIIRQQLQQTDKTILQIAADTGVSVLTVITVLSDLQNDLVRIDRRLKDIERQRFALEREEAQLLSLKHRTISRTSTGKITYDLRFDSVEPAVFYFTDEDGTRTELLTAYLNGESVNPHHMTIQKVPSMYQDAFIAAWAAAVLEYKELDEQRKEQATRAAQQIDDIINNLLRNQEKSDIDSIPEPNKKAIVRTLEKSFHPDNGGDQSIFNDVQKIKNLLNTGTV